MTAEQEAKLYAAVLYVLTGNTRDWLSNPARELLAEQIVAEITERKLLG